MKVILFTAALAAATAAHAGSGDYLGAEPRQLGRRLDHDIRPPENGTGPGGHRLEGRASSGQAKARAAAAAAAASKAKVKAASSAKAAASSRSKSLASVSSSLSSKSKSLASKASFAASKASSLASRSSSISSAAAASASAAASVSSSLASQQQIADASASSLSSLASANSAAAASISFAQASISSAAVALSQSIAGATASAGQAASSASAARSSLSAEAASLSSQASSVSSASAAAASWASALSVKSASLDSASSSLAADVDSVSASFGLVSSAMSSQSSVLAASSSAFAGVISSISVVTSQQSVAATALAASAAFIASQTSSLAAAATASGLATACLLPTYLGNGQCSKQCPKAYPVPFSRDGTYGLCCTAGAIECVSASPTAATVCAENYFLTVLDQQALTGTCTTTCCTVEDGVAYQFEQLGGVYPECVVAADCVNGAASADPASGLCCDEDVATCKDSSSTGALSCSGDSFFTPNAKVADKTGTCAPGCAADSFYSAVAGSNQCLLECPVKTASYPKSGSNYCCADPNAARCSAVGASIACVAGFAVTSDGKCVAAGSCPGGAADSSGVCCPPGALSCSSATVATACGLDKSLETPAQTYLNADGACVAANKCLNGASLVEGGKGRVCCADKGSLSCASAAPGGSLACDNSASYFLKPSTSTASSSPPTTGSCVKNCADSFLDPTTSTCVDQCASGSSFTDSATGRKTCCAVGQGSCDATGTALSCSVSAGYFLQLDGRTCAKTCPTGSVKASSGAYCCAKGTSDCTSGALTGAAKKCTSAFVLFDATCLAVCPARTVPATVGGVKTCACTDKNVATCALDGKPTGCDAGYSLWTPPGGLPPSCQPTCAPNTEFDYASATTGACKCAVNSTNNVKTCDVPTGAPLTCQPKFKVVGTGPSAQCAAFTCPANTKYNAVQSDCVCSLIDGIASCDATTGAPITCQPRFKLTGSGPSGECSAFTCPANTKYNADQSGCVCVLSSGVTACSLATGYPTACDSAYTLTAPTDGSAPTCKLRPVCTGNTVADAAGACVCAPSYTASGGGCVSSCLRGSDAALTIYNTAKVSGFTTAAQCKDYCHYYGGYAVAPESAAVDGGGAPTQLNCLCIIAQRTAQLSYGMAVGAAACAARDAAGAAVGAFDPAAAGAYATGKYYNLFFN